MKKLISLAALVLSLNSMALVYITTDQVKENLNADMVVAIEKNLYKDLVIGTKCEEIYDAKAARAYNVQFGDQMFLYMTPEGLDGLTKCFPL